MARVVVVGAGVSGLAAAVELTKAGADVLVLESSDVAGGALRSHRAEGFLFEDGPTSVFDSDGTARAFFRDVGIEGEIVGSRPEARERYLWHEGKLQAVPAKPAEFLKSSLLSVFERIRVLKEPFIAPAKDGVEETVSEFTARRFGSGVATKFAAAVVSGIFAGDPDRLSLDACFPELRAIEREHGSLLKGLAARAEEKRAAGGPARSGGMLTLQSGLGRAGEACAAKLGSRLRTRTRVVAVESRDDASTPAGVTVSIESGGARETLDAGAVIVATAARAAAAVPGALPESVAAVLGAIQHASIAVVQAGFREESLPGLPSGFGFLVPRGAGLESLGWIFTSHVFDGRAPKGCVALTGIFGGMLAPAALYLDDDALGALALREIGQALRMKAPPKAELLRVVRWRDVLPQYVLGHVGRIRGALEELGRSRPRIILAGNYLDGVSIPKCIASGVAAAARALKLKGAVIGGASG